MEYNYNGLLLEKIAEGYIVIGYEGNDSLIHIPVSVNGIRIIGIGYGAFTGNLSIKELYIESSPNPFDTFAIEEEAFASCENLEKISLPRSITSLGTGAFRGCTSLSEIGENLPYYAPYAFAFCSSLKNLPLLYCLSDGQFSHCTKIERLKLSDKVKEIPEDVFEHCDSLTEITIPKSVTEIMPLAFRGCEALTRVFFEDTETWVAGNQYTERYFPIDVSDPEENAKMLRTMDFDDGITGWFKK